jgi:hypothetical protein
LISFVNSLSNTDLGLIASGGPVSPPEPEKGGRGNKGKASETGGFSRQRLGDARAVLAFSPELALEVRDGSMNALAR